jgi:hypothetical protein
MGNIFHFTEQANTSGFLRVEQKSLVHKNLFAI